MLARGFPVTDFRCGDGRPVGGHQFARIVLGFVLLLGPGSVWALDGWLSSWNGAKDEARSANRPLLVMFVAEGCHSCAEMESRLSSSKARAALRNAVKTQLEWSDYKQLGQGFGVDGTPALFLFAPDLGFESYVYKRDGVMSLKSIIALGRQIDRLAGQETPAAGGDTDSSGHQAQAGEPVASPAPVRGITEFPAGTLDRTYAGKRPVRRQTVSDSIPAWRVFTPEPTRGGPSW